uniref:Relaxase n=1 Tax=Strongyloides venezuelensis TaxID=75913 RepID=A0A0K0G4G7_STRVS
MQEFTGKCAESNKIVIEDYLISLDKALSNAEEALSRLKKAINEKIKLIKAEDIINDFTEASSIIDREYAFKRSLRKYVVYTGTNSQIISRRKKRIRYWYGRELLSEKG